MTYPRRWSTLPYKGLPKKTWCFQLKFSAIAQGLSRSRKAYSMRLPIRLDGGGETGRDRLNASFKEIP